MKLSHQAVGALMLALQKSLMEQSDIVPVLSAMNFEIDVESEAHDELVVTNPPVLSLEGITVADHLEELTREENKTDAR